MQFTPGGFKAWFVQLDGGPGGLWLRDPQSVSDDTVDEDSCAVIPPEDIAEMNAGDVMENGPWSITCQMVDESWLDSLPEHPGW